MTVVNVHQAKSQLSRLLVLVEAGEEVVIARDGRPVARLVPVEAPPPRRVFGAMRDRLRLDDAILDPLDAEELAAWEGGA